MIVAVVGLGSIGLRHATNVLALGHQVIGFDPAPEGRESLERIGGQSVDDIDAAMAACSAAIISSPNALHIQNMQQAIAANCHVLVEKPLGHTDDGLEDLLGDAEKKGLVVFAALNQRFNPAVAAAHELLGEGALGQVLWSRLICSSYLPDWRPHQDYRLGYAADPKTGGVLFDIIHEFDLANFLLGPASVVAAAAVNTGSLDIAAEDCADAVLQHHNGGQTSIHVDYVTRPAKRHIEIAGTDGFLSVDVRARCLVRQGRDGAETPDGYDSR